MAVKIKRNRSTVFKVNRHGLAGGKILIKFYRMAGAESRYNTCYIIHFVVGFLECGNDFDIDVDAVGQQAAIDVGAIVALYGHGTYGKCTCAAVGCLDGELQVHELLVGAHQQVVHRQVIISGLGEGLAGGQNSFAEGYSHGVTGLNSAGDQIQALVGGHGNFHRLGIEAGGLGGSQVIRSDIQLCKRTVQLDGFGGVTGHGDVLSGVECIKLLIAGQCTLVVGRDCARCRIECIGCAFGCCPAYNLICLTGGKTQGHLLGQIDVGGQYGGIGACEHGQGRLAVQDEHRETIGGGAVTKRTRLYTIGKGYRQRDRAFARHRSNLLRGTRRAKHQKRCDGYH